MAPEPLWGGLRGPGLHDPSTAQQREEAEMERLKAVEPGVWKRSNGERLERITSRIACKRTGAGRQVDTKDVRDALEGIATKGARCAAQSLREFTEEEIRSWIEEGSISAEEVARSRTMMRRWAEELKETNRG